MKTLKAIWQSINPFYRAGIVGFIAGLATFGIFLLLT